MKKQLLSLLTLFSAGAIFAQTPIINSWTMNTNNSIAQYYLTNGSKKSSGELANITKVCYTNDSVWIKTTGMPEIFGPWKNPGDATDQDFTFRFPINPAAATNETEVPVVFAVGVLKTGVPIFGNGDAKSYKFSSNSNVNNGDGYWNGNAYYTEGVSLDTTYAGHVNQDGTYHSHATPFKLYKSYSSSVHSPIVGFAFDGYPVYGPFGYSDANNASSPIERMASSYRLREMTTRTTLPDGSNSPIAGPNVSTSFPLGMYIEDYEYVNGLGDLDEHNGRFCKTPEYPNGTYAYFVATDDSGNPKFPYYFGDTYYGVADQGNLTPNSTIQMPSNATGCILSAIREGEEEVFEITPNPANDFLNIQLASTQAGGHFDLTIFNSTGMIIYEKADADLHIDLSGFAKGIYFVSLSNIKTGARETLRFVKQ